MAKISQRKWLAKQRTNYWLWLGNLMIGSRKFLTLPLPNSGGGVLTLFR
jgi:hypothetical protein